MPNADQDALRAIRAGSTALQEWTNDDGEKMWPEGESPRSWGRVTWSGDRVQELDLERSGLEVLAPQIGQLTALTNLELCGCRQLKELPPQIGQLTALTNLNLNGCRQLKELPPQIGQLTALGHLYLHGCDQLKELPPQIGQLTALITLTLHYCEQLKELPPEIGQLTAVIYLYLWGCHQLKELPPQIGQLTAITRLFLHGCDQLKELPPQIGQLTVLTEINLHGCTQLKELPPQIGQLTVLTKLDLHGCTQLKELPPQFGQLLALTNLDLNGCTQLTLAPGAEEGQPAQTIVAAYARLLLIEAHKDAPGELHALLLGNPQIVVSFFRTITDAAHATWLGQAVKAAPELAKLTDDIGRRAIDVAHPACRQMMQAALFLLGRFDVDNGKLLHRSATAAVAAANDHGDPEAKPVPRVALKAMRGAEQVRAELEGRLGLDHQYVIAIKAVYADEEAVDAGEWETLERAAKGLEGVELQRVPGLSRSIPAHLFPSKQEMDRAPADDASSEYKLLIVLELADRNLKHTIDHEHIAGKDWHAIRHVASRLGQALDHVHTEGGIHADLKPLNAVSDGITWKLIDFDIFCKVGEPFGNKIPSSGYCPPEMAKVLLAATDQDTGEVDTSRLKEYVASEAYDLWSFGVVLYHLCFERPLWLTDINDNITVSDLRKLAATPQKVLKKALYEGGKSNVELAVATDLLRKLLEPDPEKRLAHFDIETAPTFMRVVLDEPFFKVAKPGDTETQRKMEEIQKGVNKIQEEQDKQTAQLVAIKELSLENKSEILQARKALMKGIFEATEVQTPTTFIILDEMLSAEEQELSAEEQDQLLSLKEDGSGIELAGSLKVAKERLDKAKTWLDRLKTFGEGVIENNPNKVFGKIKEVFGELMTKETMYFYLVDELTGQPVRGDGYPIKITTPAEIVPKLLPVMQVGMRAMSLYNGVAGVAQMVGYPAPKVPEPWRKGAQSSVEMLKQESSVEKFGAVHANLQERDNEQETTRGESLRELQRFFEAHDKDKGYAGLRRIADKDGTAVWTLLKETEQVKAQLDKRSGERREEERRRDDLLSALARTPSEAANDVVTLRAEVETLRAELKAAREKATEVEMLRARAELKAAREKEAKARGEAEMARGETMTVRAEADAAEAEVEAEADAAEAEGEKLDKPPGCHCSLL